MFLDIDKVTGFDPEENWEKRLYEMSRCHAVILVLTPNWLAAKWCFVEMMPGSRALGKLILPIVCKPLGQSVVLPEIQSVDLLDWNADGLEKLEQRLRSITNELFFGHPTPAHSRPRAAICLATGRSPTKTSLARRSFDCSPRADTGRRKSARVSAENRHR